MAIICKYYQIFLRSKEWYETAHLFAQIQDTNVFKARRKVLHFFWLSYFQLLIIYIWFFQAHDFPTWTLFYTCYYKLTDIFWPLDNFCIQNVDWTFIINRECIIWFGWIRQSRDINCMHNLIPSYHVSQQTFPHDRLCPLTTSALPIWS